MQVMMLLTQKSSLKCMSRFVSYEKLGEQLGEKRAVYR